MVSIPYESNYSTPIYRAQVAETKVIVKNKWVTPSILQAIQHGINKCICTNRPFNQIVICKLDSPKLIGYGGRTTDGNYIKNPPHFRLTEDTTVERWIPITEIYKQLTPEVVNVIETENKQMYEVLTSHPPSEQNFLDNSSNNICTGAELHHIVDKLRRYGDHVVVESDKTLLEKPQNYSGIIRTIRIVNEMSGMVMFDITTTLDPDYSYSRGPVPVSAPDKRK